MEFVDRKNQGQTTAQAGLGAGASALGGSVGWMAGAKAGALIGGGIGAMFGGVGAAPGAAVGAIVGGLAGGFGGASLGGKLADDLSGVNAGAKKLNRGVGGDIVGGYGLKGQSFKDAPKTSIITDDKGRPYVGHKALKNGKLTYIRSSAPGTGTTNPLEALGRMINPGAYKDSDAKIGMKNQKIAMVNALESMQKQGMAPDAQARMMKQMGGNLKDVQNDLNYRRKTQASTKERERSQRISAESQKRLNDLTWNNVGPDMMPRRFAEENRVRRSEYDKKGGFFGQMGRWSQRAFGGAEANKRLDTQQKASEARSKQAGAASIGRYYSSSDGKYYKNYNAAKLAREQRLKSGVKPLPKSKPKVTVAGGGMGGRRGGGAKPSTKQKAPSPSPKHPKNGTASKPTYGIK
jgi:hypothetical protein